MDIFNKKRIMLATDIHYLSKRINDRGEAFKEAMAKGDGKVVAYIEEIVDDFFNEVKKRRPDVLILPGDLTFNGERKSHEDLSDKLRDISESGISVYVIPGNHDINCNKSVGFLGEDTYSVDSVSAEEFREIYSFCGYEDYEYFDKYSGSYIVRLTPNLYLLMLDTNSYERNRVGEESIARLDNILNKIYKSEGRVLAVSHQNILEHNSIFTKGFVIENADRIREIYRKYNIPLNLSGHMHIQHIMSEGIVEIVTSSLAVSPNHFANIIYDGSSFDYFTESLKVEAVENFNEISKKEFENVGARQISRLFKSDEFKDLSSERIKELSDAFIKMNEVYFAGEALQTEGLEEIINFWKSQNESYTSAYIKSILQSVFKEQKSCKILIR